MQTDKTTYEVIDSHELAKRWSVHVSWVREMTRSRTADPIPNMGLGKYKRFEWLSPYLLDWWERRRSKSKK